MLAGIEEKRIFGNRSVKVRIFPSATTHYMYDYLKLLIKKNPDNIILHVGTNNLVNKTSRDILNEILSFKNVIEKLCPTCKLRGSNLIYRSDTLNALNIDVVDNRNIGGNCLNNSGLRLNSTGYGKLAIIFIQKMKNLSKN